jgi:predicted Zn-dependent protease
MLEVDALARRPGPALAHGLLSFAAAEAPSDPRIAAALAEARAVAGDSGPALEAVGAAVQRAPAELEVRLRAARVAWLRSGVEIGSPQAASALAEAEEQYRAALALAPGSGSAWFGLGQTLLRAGRSDAALEALRTARRHGWSAPLDVALARLELERGERERAVDLLRPIAQDPHGGALQEEAARLLEQALR